MKILSIHIYGYGKIIDQKFDLNHDFIQIFGENEAGKSTMMSFIHSVLFGFPKRSEGEPRREPRLGNAYGGRIKIQFEDEDGPVEIERIKGNRAIGDVIVYMPDGTTRTEEWLTKKLNYIDKATFRSIFSFDVLGLQDINKNLTEKDLQDYLLRAGALGSNKYEDMLNAINKELDKIYKKNGINPELNQQLTEVQAVNEKINQVEVYEERYKDLISEQHKINDSINVKKQAIHTLKQALEDKMKDILYHGEIKEWKQLETKLDVDPIEFPEKGIERYEALKNHLVNGQKDAELRQKKLEALIREERQIELPDEEEIKLLEEVVKQEPDIKHTRLEINRLNITIEKNEEQIHNLMNDIGWKEEYMDVDDSNIVRENVQSLLSKYDEVNLLGQFYSKEIDHLKGNMKQLEEEITNLQNTQISDAQMRAKKEVMDLEFELKEKERMYTLIERDYEREKEEREKRNKFQSTLIISISGVLIFIGLFYFIFMKGFLFGSLFLAIGLLSLLLLKIGKKEETDTLKTDYEAEVNTLKEKIKEISDTHDIDFDFFDAKDRNVELKNLISERISNSIKLEDLEETRAISDSTIDQLNLDLSRVKEKLKVPENTENGHINSIIYTVRDIKQLRRLVNKDKTEKEKLEQEISHFSEETKEKIKNIAIEFHINSIFYEAKNLLEKMRKDLSTYKNLREQINLFENEVNVITNRNFVAEQEIKKLLQFVDADDEDEYYYYGRKHSEYEENVRRFTELSNKLDEEHYDQNRRMMLAGYLTADLKDEETRMRETIDTYQEQMDEEQNALAEVSQEIKHLERDGQLSELHHMFEIEKNQIEEYAMDYMSLSYIKNLIEAHIKAIKDERLPIVVEEARTIFEYITKGRYIDVMYDNNVIKVKHSNGQIFDPTEISQSTKELLYIALRISLIKALKSYYQLPVIIDDAFVHFDEERTKTILNYFRTNIDDQVLFFTCNLERSIPSQDTIVLKEKIRR